MKWIELGNFYIKPLIRSKAAIFFYYLSNENEKHLVHHQLRNRENLLFKYTEINYNSNKKPSSVESCSAVKKISQVSSCQQRRTQHTLWRMLQEIIEKEIERKKREMAGPENVIQKIKTFHFFGRIFSDYFRKYHIDF